jgi:hypothetical protein
LIDELIDAGLTVDVRGAYARDSYHLIAGAYSTEFCDRIIEFIDSVESGDGVEKNYSDTETRIWSAEKRCEEIRRFREDSEKLITGFLQTKQKFATVLAIKNEELVLDDESDYRVSWSLAH